MTKSPPVFVIWGGIAHIQQSKKGGKTVCGEFKASAWRSHIITSNLRGCPLCAAKVAGR